MSATFNTAEQIRLGAYEAKLVFTPGIKRALASSFFSGQFPPDTNAMLEFLDNAAAFRQRETNSANGPTQISVFVGNNELVVRDEGMGTDQNGIAGFLAAGDSTRTGVSALGVGAKSAVFFFGGDLTIRSRKNGQLEEYTCSMPGFGNPEQPYDGSVEILQSQAAQLDGKGYFEIHLQNMTSKVKVKPLVKTAEQIYRPLLSRNGSSTRKVVDTNGTIVEVNDCIDIRVEDKKNEQFQVAPVPYKLVEGDENSITISRTDEGEVVWYWYGQKQESMNIAEHVDPGFRMYYDGRLITTNFLGHSAHDPRLRNLIGEVHLDHIVDIKDIFSLNKTGGIDKSSSTWKRIMDTLSASPLGEYVNKLLEQPLELSLEKPAFFDDSASAVRKLLRESIGSLDMGGIAGGSVLGKLEKLLDGEPVNQMGGTILPRKKDGAVRPRHGSIRIRTRGEQPTSHNEKKRGGPIKGIEIENGDGVMPYRFIDGTILLDMNNPIVQIRMKDQANTMIFIGEVMAYVLGELVAENGADERAIREGIIRALGQNIRNHPVYRKHLHLSGQ